MGAVLPHRARAGAEIGLEDAGGKTAAFFAECRQHWQLLGMLRQIELERLDGPAVAG